MDEKLQSMLDNHPCFNEAAHAKFARMHLPVAPTCNIQCNYCNRKFDCVNESRPGVTSEVLTPEQAISKVAYVRERIPNLTVIGIAGPGDPLANEQTFTTLALLKERFPDLIPCISTNGLALPENASRLRDLGVRFITVTINAPDADTGSRIYSTVLFEGRKYTGKEGAEILLRRQLEGIRVCAELGMLVKANIVMVPDVNVPVIPELVKKVKSLGAHIVNILPLIPVPGTPFGELRGPTPAERKALMDRCSLDARMMRHCRQCRADAIGLLGEDRSSEFAGCGYGDGNRCGPVRGNDIIIPMDPTAKHRIAAASSSGSELDCGFGNAPFFFVYDVDGDDVSFVRKIAVPGLSDTAVGRSHKEHIESIADLLDGCDTVIVHNIGDMPRSVLEGRGVRIVVSSGSVRSVVSSASRP